MSLRLSGGRKLESPPGAKARPTPSRVRQAVLNHLAPELDGCRWLDLCTGSGAMACEALQRGARLVVAVEQDRRLASLARRNLELVLGGVPVVEGGPEPGTGRVQVHCCEVVRWLQRGCQGQPFDLIYADPPYRAGLYPALAQAISQGGWLSGHGRLLLECASDAAPAVPPTWSLDQQRRYGSTSVIILRPWGPSGVEGAAAAVLVPGGHEQTQQRHGDQAEHDAAEQGFDHGDAQQASVHNLPMGSAIVGEGNGNVDPASPLP
ncbi:16S rRNA m2G966 methyltransferase [Cyanobium sp. NS01]|nr:16S rRNA m2G966 methyltransferase [Cyanobium sp. NS01]